jgi:hypothetical protein
MVMVHLVWPHLDRIIVFRPMSLQSLQGNLGPFVLVGKLVIYISFFREAHAEEKLKQTKWAMLHLLAGF